MFAHQVIEDLKSNKYSDEGYESHVNICIEAILQSQHFHLGDAHEFMESTNFKAGGKLFVDNAQYLKLPYNTCWFDATINNNLFYSKFGALIFGFGKDTDVITIYLFISQKERRCWYLLPFSIYYRIGKEFDKETITRIMPSMNYEDKSSDGKLHNVLLLKLAKQISTDDMIKMQNISSRILSVVEQSILLLNCKNITTENNYPDKKLNKCRRNRGK